jgi:hypothetical protein
MDWNQISQWFITAFFGAAIVKLIDLVVNRYLKRQTRKEERIKQLIEFLNDYGELVGLYRFKVQLSEKLVEDESGGFLKDDSGNYVVESKILEPEIRFEEAVREMDGRDINSSITQKIVKIRLKSSEARDISLEIDSSGELDELLKKLYFDTIFSIESVLKNKNSTQPIDSFVKMSKALDKADEARNQIRKKLQSHLNK